MSVLPEETRRDRDAAWEQNPPPAASTSTSTSPLPTVATLAVPELLRALEPFVNQAATELARIDPGVAPTEGSLANVKSAGANDHRAVDSSATQRALADRLDVVRPRLAEPDSLFPRTDFSSGGIATAPSHLSGGLETRLPYDVSSDSVAASRAPLSQLPLGDSRSFEGRSGGLSGLDGAGAQTIADLATRLLQAATRLEQLAERHNADAPRPYRSTPRPFRDRVEG